MKKSKSFQQNPFFSYGLYAFLAFLAFSPCLLFGQAYFDNDLLAQFGPWRAFLKDQLSQGHFPLWNPYSLGGQPFFADLQNMMLYPFNYLTLPFSVPYGLSVFFFLHMFWSASGMHGWLRSFNLSENACRVGALLFALSNFFWLELIHPPVLAAYSWLPWLFWSLENWSRDPKSRKGFFAGLAFAMLFLCGSFQVTVGAFYGGLAYFLFRFFGKTSPGKGKGDLKTYFFAALLFLWGALPLLGQLIPTLEFSQLSDRASTPQTYGQVVPNTSLNPSTLYQFLFPRFTLPPEKAMAEAVQFNDTPVSLLANWGYLGIWIPLLAFWAFRAKGKKPSLFFLSFSFVTLAVCLGQYLPFHRWLFELLPGFSLVRVPYRFLYLYVLALSALAAFGFEEWQASKPQTKGIAAGLKGPLFYSFLLYLVSLFHPARNWREMAALGLGFAGIALANLPALGKRSASNEPDARKRWGTLLFQIALLFPLILNGWADFVPGPSSNYDYEKNSRAILAAADSIKPNRLLFFNQEMYYPIEVSGQKYLLNYPQNAACALKIKNFGGYNPLMLQTKRDIGTLGLGSLVQLGAIQGILTSKDKGKIPGFKMKSFPPYQFYEYEKPLPYAYAPQDQDFVAEGGLSLLGAPTFDPSQVAYIEDNPSLPHWEGPVSLTCRIKEDGIDQQSFNLDLNRESLVVFCEVMYPGWKALVDGNPAPLVTADYFLRALYLKSGRHEVEFRFEPVWLRPIQMGEMLWILMTLGFFIVRSRKLREKINA